MARTPILSRRDWLRLSTAGALGASMSGWMETLAADTAKYAPLIVGTNNGFAPNQSPEAVAAALKVPDLAAPESVGKAHVESRLGLLQDMEQGFLADHPELAARSHHTAYERAVRLMRTEA